MSNTVIRPLSPKARQSLHRWNIAKEITSKLAILALLCFTFSYFVPACSTGKHLTEYSNVWGTVEGQSEMTDENLAKLMSQLRPHPGDPEAHYKQECWYLEQSHYEEAINELKKAIYIKPDHGEAYNALGVAYDQKGDFAAAGYAYKMALQLNPNHSYIHNNLAYALILQGKNKEAIDSLKEAIAQGSDSTVTHNNLGLAYAFSGRFDLAMKEFEYTGNSAFAHELFAKMQYQKGNFDKAKKYYKEALEINPESASSQEGLERSTLLGRFSAALAQLKTAIATKKQSGSAQNESSSDGAISLAGVGMEVSNGNGVSSMAKNMGLYLDQRGFHIVRLTNADNFKHSRTTVYYKKEFNEATRELAEQLPEIPDLKEVKSFDRPNVGMKIVLGKDLVTNRKAVQKEKR
jgi:Flp pilus assembly protein TadD